jgi:hypothetical protein
VSFLALSCKVALPSCLDFTVHLRLFNINGFLFQLYLLTLQWFRIFQCTPTTAMRYIRLWHYLSQNFAGS